MRRTPIKFAPVAPLHLMEELLNQGRDVVGDYHLLLAHDVLANPGGWKKWAEDLRCEFANAFLPGPIIIMDNSVIELGKPAEMRDIIKAANVVGADVAVFPDVIGDAAATMQLLEDFKNEIDRTDPTELGLYDGLEYMCVPQGNTPAEYVASMEAYNDFGFISWLGLPRDALKHGCTSRKQLIEAAALVCPQMKLHLLGFSDDLIDDFNSAHYHPNVIGIDSAVPIRAGQKHVEFKMSNSDYGKREDFWEREEQLATMTLCNLARVREYLR